MILQSEVPRPTAVCFLRLSQVPLEQAVAAVTVKSERTLFRRWQFVRVRQGEYKNDLAQVCRSMG